MNSNHDNVSLGLKGDDFHVKIGQREPALNKGDSLKRVCNIRSFSDFGRQKTSRFFYLF